MPEVRLRFNTPWDERELQLLSSAVASFRSLGQLVDWNHVSRCVAGSHTPTDCLRTYLWLYVLPLERPDAVPNLLPRVRLLPPQGRRGGMTDEEILAVVYPPPRPGPAPGAAAGEAADAPAEPAAEPPPARPAAVPVRVGRDPGPSPTFPVEKTAVRMFWTDFETECILHLVLAYGPQFGDLVYAYFPYIDANRAKMRIRNVLRSYSLSRAKLPTPLRDLVAAIALSFYAPRRRAPPPPAISDPRSLALTMELRRNDHLYLDPDRMGWRSLCRPSEALGTPLRASEGGRGARPPRRRKERPKPESPSSTTEEESASTADSDASLWKPPRSVIPTSGRRSRASGRAGGGGKGGAGGDSRDSIFDMLDPAGRGSRARRRREREAAASADMDVRGAWGARGGRTGASGRPAKPPKGPGLHGRALPGERVCHTRIIPVVGTPPPGGEDLSGGFYDDSTFAPGSDAANLTDLDMEAGLEGLYEELDRALMPYTGRRAPEGEPGGARGPGEPGTSVAASATPATAGTTGSAEIAEPGEVTAAAASGPPREESREELREEPQEGPREAPRETPGEGPAEEAREQATQDAGEPVANLPAAPAAEPPSRPAQPADSRGASAEGAPVSPHPGGDDTPGETPSTGGSRDFGESGDAGGAGGLGGADAPGGPGDAGESGTFPGRGESGNPDALGEPGAGESAAFGDSAEPPGAGGADSAALPAPHAGEEWLPPFPGPPTSGTTFWRPSLPILPEKSASTPFATPSAVTSAAPEPAGYAPAVLRSQSSQDGQNGGSGQQSPQAALPPGGPGFPAVARAGHPALGAVPGAVPGVVLGAAPGALPGAFPATGPASGAPVYSSGQRGIYVSGDLARPSLDVSGRDARGISISQAIPEGSQRSAYALGGGSPLGAGGFGNPALGQESAPVVPQESESAGSRAN